MTNQNIEDIIKDVVTNIDNPHMCQQQFHIDKWVEIYNYTRSDTEKLKLLQLMFYKNIGDFYQFKYIEMSRYFQRKGFSEASLYLLGKAVSKKVHNLSCIKNELSSAKKLMTTKMPEKRLSDQEIYKMIHPKKLYLWGKEWVEKPNRYFYDFKIFFDFKTRSFLSKFEKLSSEIRKRRTKTSNNSIVSKRETFGFNLTGLICDESENNNNSKMDYRENALDEIANMFNESASTEKEDSNSRDFNKPKISQKRRSFIKKMSCDSDLRKIIHDVPSFEKNVFPKTRNEEKNFIVEDAKDDIFKAESLPKQKAETEVKTSQFELSQNQENEKVRKQIKMMKNNSKNENISENICAFQNNLNVKTQKNQYATSPIKYRTEKNNCVQKENNKFSKTVEIKQTLQKYNSNEHKNFTTNFNTNKKIAISIDSNIFNTEFDFTKSRKTLNIKTNEENTKIKNCSDKKNDFVRNNVESHMASKTNLSDIKFEVINKNENKRLDFSSKDKIFDRNTSKTTEKNISSENLHQSKISPKDIKNNKINAVDSSQICEFEEFTTKIAIKECIELGNFIYMIRELLTDDIYIIKQLSASNEGGVSITTREFCIQKIGSLTLNINEIQQKIKNIENFKNCFPNPIKKCKNNEAYYFIFQNYKYVSLRQILMFFIQEYGTVEEELLVFYYVKICNILLELSENNIFLVNLIESQILIDKDFNVTLANFNFFHKNNTAPSDYEILNRLLDYTEVDKFNYVSLIDVFDRGVLKKLTNDLNQIDFNELFNKQRMLILENS
ncbi:hypothetical protein EDEG_01243 [Edhazardia aedis USNM 41457]|uniref:Uncharacterized protein n=1 Tax=Edhazardia aedis (strain USNM 41457) TaxID=1003232 RepID=J9DPU3_EDHAE|nr:hypothetical protein EDEG_01243 [Edhazardia aedis USNM 41457]|eukprot:EJW04560.1 hypothetical protein EDEG_01243 [Edhazardia aedis USNM 41457]